MSWFSEALFPAPRAVGGEDNPSLTSSMWTSRMAGCCSEGLAPPAAVDRTFEAVVVVARETFLLDGAIATSERLF